MKTALILNGLSRIYKDTYEAMFKALDGLNPDIYIYTWDIFTEGTATEGFKSLLEIYDPKVLVVDNYRAYANKQEVFNKMEFLTTQQRERKLFCNCKLDTGLVVQHNTIQKAFNLIENPEQYDFIIRNRFDFMFDGTPDWDDVYKQTRSSLLYPAGKRPGLNNTPYRICDLFAVGKPSDMKTYCSLYPEIMNDTYLNEMLKYRCGKPEYVLALHLARNNVNYTAYPFKYVMFRHLQGKRK